MLDHISTEQAQTLPGLFQQRVRRTPEFPAYMFFDALNEVWTHISWISMHFEIRRWIAALHEEKLNPGDRVAIMARNSRYWVMFDQAALAMGLVVVPLYTEDRADNVSYILKDAGVKLLIIGGQAQWQRLQVNLEKNRTLKRIIAIGNLEDAGDKRIRQLRNWLPADASDEVLPELGANDLATIVYTSGTTGRPKGVMLSHRNILSNAEASLAVVPVETGHVFLSFLPLSHTLERTIGYYLPVMAGATVAHARSIQELAGDLLIIKPHGLISVPRIYERVYARIRDTLATSGEHRQRLFRLAVEVGWHRFEVQQGRARRSLKLLLWPILKYLVADRIVEKLGGRLLLAISGGAALSPEISRVFIGLGLPILQGYGLTEASPVISVNKLENNLPASIGIPLQGVEVRIGENEELQVRGENVMLGYWNNDAATREVIDADGWLATGDKARQEDGHLFITGRIKDIIVLANGEKVSPVDMELSICSDNLFEQVLIIGESRPFLSALAVLNETVWQDLLKQHNLDTAAPAPEKAEEILLQRITKCLHNFPGYVEIHRVTGTTRQWTADNGLLTPTMKVRRPEIQKLYQAEIENMYTGH